MAKKGHFMLLTNAKIYTMSAGVIESGFIFVKDGKIAKVGKMDELGGLADEEEINLNGQSVYPGFVDAHTHMGLFENGLGIEGEDGNEYTDPTTPHLKAIDAATPWTRSTRWTEVLGRLF